MAGGKGSKEVGRWGFWGQQLTNVAAAGWLAGWQLVAGYELAAGLCHLVLHQGLGPTVGPTDTKVPAQI